MPVKTNPPTTFTFHVSRFTLHAFTLLELLTVIAIMAILAAIALPTLRGFKPNAKVAATRQMLDAVSRARQLAISQRSRVYMVFLSTNFFTGLSGTNLGRVEPLLDKQLVGYAYVSRRSVGDQPGVQTPSYLSKTWRTLPQGAYIPLAKFSSGFTIPGTTLGTLQIQPFSMTNNLPFPSEDNPVTALVWLPFIAFEGNGQLWRDSWQVGQPELIPIAEGGVSYARNPNTKTALPQPPQVTETPAGNTIDNYSLVWIDPLTGRAHVERRKVQ